jgi:F-type H+-transporting ATPase subunit delta
MTEVGSVYGQALYDLAASEGLEESILSQLTTLTTSFQEAPEFLKLLSTPSLSKPERCRILDDSFRGRIQPYLLNFLKILTEKGYIRHFSHCCEAYRNCYNRDRGIVPVTVITAVPLTKTQEKKLREKLVTIIGKKVELNAKVDPSCLGGVRLDYVGKRLDDTVAHRLDAIRSVLKNTVL